MEKHYSAGIVVYRKQESNIEYLILHYAKGHWDLPKGHLELGETNEEAALRELEEETGLEIAITPGFEESFSYIFIEDGQMIDKTVSFFVGQAEKDNVILSDEHIDYKWLSLNDALNKLTYENACDILQKVHVFLKKALKCKKR